MPFMIHVAIVRATCTIATRFLLYLAYILTDQFILDDTGLF
jgi:hypothetical protein